MNILPSKYDSEHIVIPFDFSPGLETGEAITTINSVSYSLNSGSGTISLGTSQISGALVLVPVLGGVSGSSYVVSAVVDTSNPDKRLEIKALLPIE